MASTISKQLQLIVSLKGAAAALGQLKKISEGIFFIGNAAKMVKDKLMSLLSPIKDVIKASMEQEDIFNQLRATVNMLGLNYNKSEKSIKSFLARIQATTIYGDTQMAPVLQEILFFTGDLDKAFKGAEIAAGLAASGLFDLGTAGRYVGMAMEGNVEMLGRYIPQLRANYGLINQNMTAEQKWAVAKKILTDKTEGLAEATRGSLKGMVESIKNEWGDLQEALGDAIANKLKPRIEKISKWFTDIGENIGWDVVAKFIVENYKIIWDSVKQIFLIKMKEAWIEFVDWVKDIGMEYLKNSVKMAGKVALTLIPGGGLLTTILGLTENDKKETVESVDDVLNNLYDKLLEFKNKKAGIDVILPTDEGKTVPRKPPLQQLKNPALESYKKMLEESYKIEADFKSQRPWLPGEVTEEEWEKILVKNKYGFDGLLSDYEKYLNDTRSIVDQGAGAFTAFFDVIAINANNAEKRVLNSLTSITSAIPQALGLINQMKLGSIGGLAGGLGIAGIGIGLVGSLIGMFTKDKESERAASQARQDRQARTYGAVSRATPMNVTVVVTTSITGQTQIFSDGRVSEENINKLVGDSIRQQLSTGELNPNTYVQTAIGPTS